MKQHTSIARELAQGRTVTYFTLGTSMEPLLKERQTHVVIAPLKIPKNGDILLYLRKNGSYVLHRCIRRDDSHYYMRGDNTIGLEAIDPSQAIGVVTHIYRKSRYLDVEKHRGYRFYSRLWQALYPLRLLRWKLGRLLHERTERK